MTKPQIGDIIPFGEYNWRVLDVREDKALIITEDVVEQRAYNVYLMYMTWEMCRLREYLNGEFLNKFDVSRIVEVTNPNPDNLWCETKGNPTQDKIFLLSLEEVDKYFGNSGDYLAQRRKSYDDEFYLDDDGIWVTNNHDSSRIASYMGEDCWWWLRSPGDGYCYECSDTTAYVTEYGSVLVTGEYIRRQHGGVRPALWLNLYGGNEKG